MNKWNTLVYFKLMLVILIVIISNIVSALWVHSCLLIHHIVMVWAPPPHKIEVPHLPIHCSEQFIILNSHKTLKFNIVLYVLTLSISNLFFFGSLCYAYKTKKHRKYSIIAHIISIATDVIKMIWNWLLRSGEYQNTYIVLSVTVYKVLSVN